MLPEILVGWVRGQGVVESTFGGVGGGAGGDGERYGKGIGGKGEERALGIADCGLQIADCELPVMVVCAWCEKGKLEFSSEGKPLVLVSHGICGFHLREQLAEMAAMDWRGK